MDASGRVSLPRSKAKNNINVKTDGDIKEDKKCTFRRRKEKSMESSNTIASNTRSLQRVQTQNIQIIAFQILEKKN